jgi:hypothetical protein
LLSILLTVDTDLQKTLLGELAELGRVAIDARFCVAEKDRQHYRLNCARGLVVVVDDDAIGESLRVVAMLER